VPLYYSMSLDALEEDLGSPVGTRAYEAARAQREYYYVPCGVPTEGSTDFRTRFPSETFTLRSTIPGVCHQPKPSYSYKTWRVEGDEQEP